MIINPSIDSSSKPCFLIQISIAILLVIVFCSSCFSASNLAPPQGPPLGNNVLACYANGQAFAVSTDRPGARSGFPRDKRGALGTPAISPDRRSIAYVSYRLLTYDNDLESTSPADGEIWVMGSHGESPHKIRNLLSPSPRYSLASSVWIDWTPDGKKLVCLECVRKQFNLYAMDMYGNITAKTSWEISSQSEPECSLAVSQDGTRVAYLVNTHEGGNGFYLEKEHCRIALRTLSPNGFGPERVLIDKYGPAQDQGALFSFGISWLSAHEVVIAESQGQSSNERHVPTASVVCKVNTETKHIDPVFNTTDGYFYMLGPTISPNHQDLSFVSHKSVPLTGNEVDRIVTVDLSNRSQTTVIPNLNLLEYNLPYCVNWSSP